MPGVSDYWKPLLVTAYNHHVDTPTIQIITATLMCFVGILLVYRLARHQKLSFRYAVGWMVMFGIGVLTGILLPLTTDIADLLGLSPAALLSLAGILVFLSISIQISISISGLQENARLLAERLAQLQLEIEEMSKR
jgi:hypothetical protein